MNIRDMPNPSGADVEAFVNRQFVTLQKASSTSFLAQDYDIKCTKIPEYPGSGWEYVESHNIGSGQIAIVWRKSRVLQAQQGEESGMKLVNTKP